GSASSTGSSRSRSAVPSAIRMRRSARSRARSSKSSMAAASSARTSCGSSAAPSSWRSADPTEELAPVILRSKSSGLFYPHNGETMMRRGVLLLLAAGLALSPVAAQQQRYLNPQDIAEAQREHAEVVQELGGAET